MAPVDVVQPPLPADPVAPTADVSGGMPMVTRMQDPKEKFYRHFQTEVTAIQEQIDNLGSLAAVGGERQDAVDFILASISRLSNEVSDAADYVPAYDQRTYSQAIKALTDRLNQTTTKLAPRTRFQFKSRAPRSGGAASTAAGATAAPSVDTRILGNPSAAAAAEDRDSVGDLPSFAGPTSPSSPSAAAQSQAAASSHAAAARDYNHEIAQPGSGQGPESRVRKPSFSTARDIAIAGHTGLHIILPQTASRATSSGRLTDIARCVVDMSRAATAAGHDRSGGTGTPFANLALQNIQSSLVVAGAVAGPLHVTGLTNSVLVVAARQVRVHECRNVDIYLYCGSHPIIEDCSDMRFAPLPGCFTHPDDPVKNQWDQVDDFKWLKAEKSPNWSVLPEEERIADDIWTRVVPGEIGRDHHDILKAVGIKE